MLKKILNRFIKEESGQGMIEYAILAALLVVALIFVIRGLGGSVGNKFNKIKSELDNTNPTP